LHRLVLYHTVLYCTVLHCSCTALHCTVLRQVASLLPEEKNRGFCADVTVVIPGGQEYRLHRHGTLRISTPFHRISLSGGHGLQVTPRHPPPHPLPLSRTLTFTLTLTSASTRAHSPMLAHSHPHLTRLPSHTDSHTYHPLMAILAPVGSFLVSGRDFSAACLRMRTVGGACRSLSLSVSV
jgi:hypothetical protein